MSLTDRLNPWFYPYIVNSLRFVTERQHSTGSAISVCKSTQAKANTLYKFRNLLWLIEVMSACGRSAIWNLTICCDVCNQEIHWCIPNKFFISNFLICNNKNLVFLFSIKLFFVKQTVEVVHIVDVKVINMIELKSLLKLSIHWC